MKLWNDFNDLKDLLICILQYSRVVTILFSTVLYNSAFSSFLYVKQDFFGDFLCFRVSIFFF